MSYLLQERSNIAIKSKTSHRSWDFAVTVPTVSAVVEQVNLTNRWQLCLDKREDRREIMDED